MRAETLSWLACPAPGCAGALQVGAHVAPSWAEDAHEELLEGILVCAECRAEYPVILGAAILVPEQQRYLWGFWNEIESCATEMPGAQISPGIRSYLGAPSATTGLAAPRDVWDESLDWTTSPFFQAHFDPESLTNGIPEGWWQAAVNGFLEDKADPYTYLAGSALRLGGGDSDGLAVEIGASVGRTAADLAGGYRFVVGTDWSFRSVFAARRLLLHQPSRLESYAFEMEAGTLHHRELPLLEPRRNLDYVVADGAALPFPAASAACVAALNVICAVPQPHSVLAETARVTAPGGLLLFSSPYWGETSGAAPRAGLALKSPQETRSALATAFEILSEQEMVPWLLRLTRRRWNVYLCHCLVALRRDSGTGSLD